MSIMSCAPRITESDNALTDRDNNALTDRDNNALTDRDAP